MDTINNVTHLLIKATLLNNSSDTFTYIVMSCFYPFEYAIDPNNLPDFGEEDCDKNVPQLVTIPTHKNFQTIIDLPVKKNIAELAGTSFKLGVYLRRVNDFIGLLNNKGENILGFMPHDWFQSVNDTSYRIGMNFTTYTTANKQGILNKFDAIATVNFLWSNTIKL